jgi:hypothetical protein
VYSAAAKLLGMGLSDSLNYPWGHARLVFNVLITKSINYCLEIKSHGFDEASVSEQVRTALSLWFQPLEGLGIRDITISKVPCAARNLNFYVYIGPNAKYPNLYAYNMEQKDSRGKFPFTKVVINTNYQYSDGSRKYFPTDFANFSTDISSQRQLMEALSILNPTDISTFHSQRMSTV